MDIFGLAPIPAGATLAQVVTTLRNLGLDA